MITLQKSPLTHTLAIGLAALANFFLGISSLYWKALHEIPQETLVAYRILLSAITLTFFIVIFSYPLQTKQFTFKSIRTHCIAALLIAVNWGTFIWSSIHNHILESGIGYLLAPFVSIILGAVIYRDPITFTQILSTTIAGILIVLLIAFTDHLNHWTYLSIAISWGYYTYLKKSTSLDAVNGLLIETLFLSACLAIAFWLFKFPLTWPSNLPEHPYQLIWLAGAVSVIPLLMFSYSTGKIPLSLTGFLQFILPLTLTTVGLIFHQQQTPHTALILISLTIGTLITLTAYDLVTSTRAKERPINEQQL